MTEHQFTKQLPYMCTIKGELTWGDSCKGVSELTRGDSCKGVSGEWKRDSKHSKGSSNNEVNTEALL